MGSHGYPAIAHSAIILRDVWRLFPGQLHGRVSLCVRPLLTFPLQIQVRCVRLLIRAGTTTG